MCGWGGGGGGGVSLAEWGLGRGCVWRGGRGCNPTG